MAYEHESGLPYAYSRVGGRQDLQSVVFYGQRPFIQGAELNDLQEIIRGRSERISRLIAADGDRVVMADIVVDKDTGTVTLSEGRIFVAGDVYPVESKVITGVPMTGSVSVGVRLVKRWITSEDDPSLAGLVPGSMAEGEPGAAREVASISWALANDGGEGVYYQVYELLNGDVLDQTPPPMLDGIQQALAAYDRPHGHYIVTGHRVRALGRVGNDQVFAVEEGEANIYGYKVTHLSSIRIAVEEDWDVGAVPGETHTYTGGASVTVTLAQVPLAEVSQILLTKEKTVMLTRGAVANGVDGLPDTSVIEIVEVWQGSTYYTQGTDFVRTGNAVDWSPTGAEPANGSTYQVKYRYRASVTADNVTDTTVTVSGGATGGDIIIAYNYKLPRVDIIGLNSKGALVYIKGVSARANPVRPSLPADVLALCEVRNNWMGTPDVVADGINTGVRMPTWAQLWRYLAVLENHSRLIQLERLRSEVDRRDPTAKKNMFVDPFHDDYYRDAGVAQTAAIGNTFMQLAITPTFYLSEQTEPVLLDYDEEVIVQQELKTSCTKINPYQNFTPLPARMSLSPAADYWTEHQTVWASPETIEFQRGIDATSRVERRETTTTIEGLGTTTSTLPFLRQISVDFRIDGFFPGEILDSLTFDGIDVTPAGSPTANESGVLTGTFTIPSGVTAGVKAVVAVGQGGSEALSRFAGQGVLSVETLRQVTTIEVWQPGFSEPVQSNQQMVTWDGGNGGGADPQAQIFRVPQMRQIVGVDFDLCAIGDSSNAVIVQQVTVDNGWPTVNVEAEGYVSMAGAVEGWKSARYKLPTTVPADTDRAFVVKTDDGDHSISYAGLGDFDASKQQAVTAHPYPVGPRLSSVNARTWTAHQEQALTFRLVAARYTSTTKTVDLGEFSLVDASDLQVRAVVEIPSADCSVVFEIERASGEIYRLLPYQVLQLPDYITETVTLRAVLRGTQTLSPILYAPIMLVAGKIATEATYVCRAFDITDAIQASAYIKLSLPNGSTFAAEYDYSDDDWKPLALAGTEISPDPAWVERNYTASISGSLMRLRLTLTGGPAARPLASDLGLAVM